MRASTSIGLILLALCGSPVHGEEPAPAAPLPDTVTLNDALRLFRQRGLDLLIAEAQVASAEGDLKVAGAVPNPSFSLGLYKSFFDRSKNGDPLFSSDLGWFVGVGDSNAIEDSLSGKRGLRLRVARAALQAARMARADAQRTLEFQVKQVYIQAVQARDALDFALEVQRSNTQTSALTDKKYRAGAISEADQAKVEAAKLESDQAVDTAGQALRAAKVGLAFLLGVRGPIPDFKVDQDLPKFVVPPHLSTSTALSLLDEAYDHRADLKQIRAQRERAASSIRLAKRLRFPDLNIGVQYSQQGSSNGSQGAGGTITPISPPTLQFSIGGTLPVFYLQKGEIRRAEADYRIQTITQAKTEAEVAADVEAAFNNYQASRRLVERMEARLLERVKKARDLVEFSYQKGNASLLEFLDAQRQYIATNVEYIQDLANYWTAVFQLEQAVGVDLR